jgi:hypothetical protein
LQSENVHGAESVNQTIRAGKRIRGFTAFLHGDCPEIRAIGTPLIYVNAAFCGSRVFAGNKAG